MQISKIHRAATGLFSNISNELVYRQEYLALFIQEVFSKKAFENQMQIKSAAFSLSQREQLVEVIKSQYSTFSDSPEVNKNIEALLDENTFTITTGHQLSLYTGPIYFIYKILHVIKLCAELKESYPTKNFVPVFWMASEDHDFEEVNHFYLFGKKIIWETDQKGPVGFFDPSSLETIKADLHQFFANKPDSEIHNLIDALSGENMGQAQQQLVHELFKSFGLIVLEPNDKRLKQQFLPIMEQEIFSSFGESAVQSKTSELEKLGFKGQVFPRPINFFYIDKGVRERVQLIDGTYSIEGIGTFSKEELKKLLNEHPERFSPNVVFRPVYQEVILPNLCYVGGGGEMAYWLQLKDVFEKANVVYPLIQVRNSLALIDAGTQKKMAKVGLNFEDFLEDIDVLKKDYVLKNATDDVDFSALKTQFENIQANLKAQLVSIDPQMVSFIEIENNKLEKQFEGIQTKVLRVQKQKMETSMKQLEDVKAKFFPAGQLQERVESFLTFCPTGEYKSLIDSLYEAIEPFERDFIVVELNP